ncbi:MAG: sodium/proton-translocating pyrophosphatase, partial [Thermoguttaceae bacterium]|nr:sodium/proton-translocating pyrophosphatase [Thermoguttaceae bacterium]
MKINNRFANGLALALLASAFAFGTNDVVPCFAQDNAPAAVAVETTETEAPVADAATVEAAQVEEQADAATSENASERAPFFGFFGFLWVLSLAGSIAALVFAVKFFKSMMKADEGNEEMIKIAAAVRKGANAYLKQQYKVVAIFFVVIWA